MKWVRVDDLIVPVRKNRKLDRKISYYIFKEGEIDIKTLIARLEPLTKGEKAAVHRYVRILATVGLVELKGEGMNKIIRALVPPIPVEAYKLAVEAQLKRTSKKELAKKLGVSPQTIDTWRRGAVARDQRILMKILQGGD